MATIRKVGTQLALVGLTIVCALAVGYAIAAFTGSPAQISPGGEFVIAPVETTVAETPAAESAAPEASASDAPDVVAPDASTPASASAAASASASPSAPASAPAAAQSETFINESFDTRSPSFPPAEEATWSAAYVDGQYQLRLDGQTNISLVGELPAIDYRLGVDVRATEGGAGVVFLGAKPSISYRMVIAPDGAYSIERQNGTTVEKVIDWTESEALAAEPGALNQLRVERRGGLVEFYANDQLLTPFEVPEGELTNRYGFVLTSRTGKGTASFDNLRGERLP